MTVVWLPAAREDVRRLYGFLLDKDPAAAARAARTIRLGADQLEETPRVGRRMPDDTRRRELVVPFGVGAFVLRYRIQTDTVVVIRVWHSRELRS